MTEIEQLQLENLYLKQQLLQTQGQLLQHQFEKIETQIKVLEAKRHEPTTETE
jgi:hypothetical protein